MNVSLERVWIDYRRFLSGCRGGIGDVEGEFLEFRLSRTGLREMMR